jgi:hypothetical protein
LVRLCPAVVAGAAPIDWRGLPGVLDDLERGAPTLSLGQLDALERLPKDYPDLTEDFRRPQRAVREFVQRCEDFYRTETEDTRRLSASAARHPAAPKRDPGRYRW